MHILLVRAATVKGPNFGTAKHYRGQEADKLLIVSSGLNTQSLPTASNWHSKMWTKNSQCSCCTRGKGLVLSVDLMCRKLTLSSIGESKTSKENFDQVMGTPQNDQQIRLLTRFDLTLKMD